MDAASTVDNSARTVLRRFRRQVLKVRDLVGEIPDDAALTYHFSAADGRVVESRFDEPEEPLKVRMAVLMRPLLAPASPIACSRVWMILKELRPSLDKEVVKNIDEALLRVEDGDMGFIVNGRRMRVVDLYEVFAAGEFFHDRADALQMLRTLRFGPMTQMLWFHFYSYCHDMYPIASALLDVIGQQIGGDVAEVIERHCIYCGTKEGMFSSEEHIVPEAFGNDDAVLPVGMVCDSCNNTCSVLDQFLAECDLFAMQRVLHVPFTKKGKLPKARFHGLTVEKRMPRVIRLSGGDENTFQIVERSPEGIRFNLNYKGTKPFDAQMFGRAMFKIGLGFVAFHAGRDEALDPKYDDARTFLRGKRPFNNNVILKRKNITPSTSIEFKWVETQSGTFCLADFYGIQVLFNLEESPRVTIDEAEPEAENFAMFSLDGRE